jgi:ATP-binding cassette, subfamily A (ABC1), member 3
MTPKEYKYNDVLEYGVLINRRFCGLRQDPILRAYHRWDGHFWRRTAFYVVGMILTSNRLMAVVFLSVWISTLARMDHQQATNTQNTVYYTIGLISPISQLLKALIVSLNLFGVLCEGTPPAKSTTPGAFNLYGGPIMFLIAQIAIMFLFLVWSDHRFSLGKLKKRSVKEIGRDQERRVGFVEREVVEEEARVMRETDGLKVLHTNKVYKSDGQKKVQAVDDLTFGVNQGEVFALVGPNGGKLSPFISFRG